MTDPSKIDMLEKMLNSEDSRRLTILPDGTIAEALPDDMQGPVPVNSPLRVAWEAYKGTFAYQNSKGWALQICPMVQAGHPDAERMRRFELMPLEQRERHVEGSLWAAFTAGFEAAQRMPQAGCASLGDEDPAGLRPGNGVRK